MHLLFCENLFLFSDVYDILNCFKIHNADVFLQVDFLLCDKKLKNISSDLGWYVYYRKEKANMEQIP